MEPLHTETTLRLFEGSYVDDGYEFMAAGEAAGWRPVSAWGADGWDLGDWPYVVVMFRETGTAMEPCPTCALFGSVRASCDTCVGSGMVGRAAPFERAIYVEGDITIETYASAGDRERATDETAMCYWRLNGERWLTRPAADLRGPYSRDRRRSS